MKTFGIIGGVVAAGLVVFFFASDPFNIWVKSTYKDATEWTPERIQENPALYLEWAQEKLDNTQKSLGARMIKMKQIKGKFEREHKGVITESANLKKKLSVLKEKYKYGLDTEFPVPIPQSGGSSVNYTKSQIEKGVDKMLKKKEMADKKIQIYSVQLTKVNKNVEMIRNRQEELSEKREYLAMQKEMVILSMEMKEVANLMDSVNAVLDIAEVMGDEELGEPDFSTIASEPEASDAATDFLSAGSDAGTE